MKGSIKIELFSLIILEKNVEILTEIMSFVIEQIIS
jgi:hypothetical protein